LKPATEAALIHQLAELLENFPQIVRVILDDLQTLIWLRLRYGRSLTWSLFDVVHGTETYVTKLTHALRLTKIKLGHCDFQNRPPVSETGHQRRPEKNILRTWNK
jgi:hypothetical protein